MEIITPLLGTLWEEQGGIYAGIVRGETDAEGNRLPDYYLIVAPGNEGHSNEKWGAHGKSEPGAQSINDGLVNTLALAESQHTNPAAEWANNLELNGFSDWYLPAKAELNICYANAREHFATDDWHWSSTQFSANDAWYQYFDDGFQNLSLKFYQGRVRAVRRFVIHSAI